MQVYGVEYNISLLMYFQFNGFVECMVQMVENIFKKCDEEGEDFYFGLLFYCMIFVSSNLKFLVELLNNCKFRIILLMFKCVSVSDIISKIKEELYQ